MKASRLFKVIAAGALATLLAAPMLLSAPTRARAQDDDAIAAPDSKTPPAAMAGTWTGTLDDTSKGGGGTATLTLDLTQVKSTVGGTFSIVGGGNPTGSVKGKVTGNKVKLLLDQTGKSHPCKVNATGVVLTLDEYKGTFKVNASKHCHGNGTFDVFLQ